MQHSLHVVWASSHHAMRLGSEERERERRDFITQHHSCLHVSRQHEGKSMDVIDVTSGRESQGSGRA